jgi:hypothetical protein
MWYKKIKNMIQYIQKQLIKKDIFLVCGILLAISLVSSTFFDGLLQRIHPPQIEGLSSNTDKRDLANWFGICIDIPFAALREEYIFRCIPMIIWIAIIYPLHMNEKKENILLIGVILLSSVRFGWLHGNIYNILLQGNTGFAFFIIFLMGYFRIVEDRKDLFYNIFGILFATAVSSACHMAFNWNIVALSSL